TANCQLPTANCQLPTANCQLPTVNCQLFLLYKHRGCIGSENQRAGKAVILLQVVTFSNNRLNLVSQES
ncbi:MAG: hypothetical protein EAZ39_30695, partial [Oscillatoriales cyanobacterium]